MLKRDDQLFVITKHQRFCQHIDSGVRLLIVRADGGPAIARIVIKRVLHVAVVTVFLLVGGEVGNGVADENVSHLSAAFAPGLQLDVREDEITGLGAGEQAFGVGGMRQNLQLQTRDAGQFGARDQAVVLMMRSRAAGLNRAIGFLLQHSAAFTF